MEFRDHGYNWDAWRHRSLYDMIHGRPGVLAETGGSSVANVSEATARWQRFTALMAEAKSRTDAALAKAGVTWEGGAADSMNAGMAPLSQWAVDAQDAGTASAGGVEQFSSSYLVAQHRMPEPVEVDSTANSDHAGIPAAFTHLFGGQTDQDRQEAEAQQAKQEAVLIMNAYHAETAAARTSVGQFVAPPAVVVRVPPPSIAGGEVGSLAAGFLGPSGVDGPGRADSGYREAVGPGPRGAVPPRGPGAVVVPAQDTSASGANPVTVGATPGGGSGGGSVAARPNPGVGLAFPGWPGGSVGPVTGRTGGGFGGGRGFGADDSRGRAGGSGGRGTGGGFGGAPAEQGGRGVGRGPSVGVGGPGVGDGSTVGHRGGGGSSGAGSRAGVGPGAGMGVGGGAKPEEDSEHFAAEYLRGTHDDFWDDLPPVAPPVIGEL
ncbi:PPE domain-containing protein [Actinokineospora sp.]|uniref:PPE domain-containing protein n=1 Tax=Actinokineospora sp. TaxID=1872133 RepID=UPI004037A99D